jgi:hypothetical protein
LGLRVTTLSPSSALIGIVVKARIPSRCAKAVNSASMRRKTSSSKFHQIHLVDGHGEGSGMPRSHEM